MHKQGGLLWTIEEILSFIRQKMGRHINNVYREGELERDITCAKFAHVGSDNDQQYVCSTYVNDCRKPDGRKGRDGEGSNQFD